jgi:hypothetical protein
MSEIIKAEVQYYIAANIAEAIDRLAEQHATAAAKRQKSEWVRDRQIKDEYFPNISRTAYWLLTKRAGFPKARAVSPRIKLRKRAEIEAWIAQQPEVA